MIKIKTFGLLLIICFLGSNILFAQIKLSDLKGNGPSNDDNSTKTKTTKKAENTANDKKPVTATKRVEKEVTTLFTEPEMVAVTGGTFKMGNESGFANEKPEHSVTLANFSIGKYEVTQKQWHAVMGSYAGKHENCDECPVEFVSWNEVQEFITKLNKKTGKTYRLPTEAEWEFAARGGTRSVNADYSGSFAIDEVGWAEENSGGITHAVGTKKSNELGLFDMSGNVWEWCADWYEKTTYASSPTDNPKGPDNGTKKVFRGGGYNESGKNSCRNTYRNACEPDVRREYIGFRLCR